ncbi:MAG TPA: site-2 protease family protein [Candidatus Elarobacter sp.]|jgi:Zn-dependent protease
MYPHGPQEPQQQYLPPEPPRPKNGRKAQGLGGILVGLALIAAKFKTALLVLLNLKWVLVGLKFLPSFASIVLSLLLYAALFGGWKIAIVFVLMILVHELGHYLTWRNFGVQTNLPMFIPGLGAFVASRGGTPGQNLAASIAGPAFGILAATVCWVYGLETGQRFWIACAYIGYFLNLFNLMPIPMLDGGAIAGALDARLWFLGIPIFIAFMFFVGPSVFSVLFLVLIAFTAIPRWIALWRGQIDPRGSGLTGMQRTMGGVAYLGLLLLAVAGAAGTHIDPNAARFGNTG